MGEFKQKKLFIKKVFTFKENGLNVFTKDSDGDYSKFISFNSIEPRNMITTLTKKNRRILRYGLLISIVTFSRGILTPGTSAKTMAVVASISLILAGLTLAAYYATLVKYYLVALDKKTAIYILRDKPTPAEAEAFIDEIYERRKQFYRSEYFFVNYENKKQSEIDKMKWLKTEDIISANEFNVVIDEINETLEN